MSMRGLMLRLIIMCLTLAAVTATLVACGDDSQGRKNNPYYDPYYSQYSCDPYRDPYCDINGYDSRGIYDRNYDRNSLTLTGEVFVEPTNFANFLRSSGLCGKPFMVFGRPRGRDNCDEVTQNAVATISIEDPKKLEDGKNSPGGISLSASFGGYAPQMLPMTFKKLDGGRYEGVSNYRGLRAQFVGRPTDGSLQVFLTTNSGPLGEGFLSRDRRFRW